MPGQIIVLHRAAVGDDPLLLPRLQAGEQPVHDVGQQKAHTGEELLGGDGLPGNSQLLQPQGPAPGHLGHRVPKGPVQVK